MRIGIGSDIHRLAEGRGLFIGGVKLDHPLGEVGFSDGDVLLHATIDALLGALAKGDIGTVFPDNDSKWKDADSKKLLSLIMQIYKPKIINIDSTVTMEHFRLNPHIGEIRASMASLLGIEVSAVSVKAKTNEGLDSLGAGWAIKAEAIVLVE